MKQATLYELKKSEVVLTGDYLELHKYDPIGTYEKMPIFDAETEDVVSHATIKVQRLPAERICRYDGGGNREEMLVVLDPSLKEIIDATVKGKYENQISQLKSEIRNIEFRLNVQNVFVNYYKERIVIYNSLPWYTKIWNFFRGVGV